MSPLSSTLLPVHHISFNDLITAGYEIRTYPDDAAAIEFDEVAMEDLPKNWKRPQPVIEPKIAKLRDAMLFKDGSALLPDGSYCYFDFVFSGEWWRKRFSHQALCDIDPDTEGAQVRPNMPSIEVSGRCFSTRSTTPENFGHFIHDMLSRIYYEDLGAIAPGRDRVIAPGVFKPMHQVLFRKVFEGYDIVHVPSNMPLKVEELFLPANMCSHEMFNPKALAALASRLRKILAPYAGREKFKVYVSRQDGKKNYGRDFVNIEAHERRMKELGYRIVEVSALDPESQFALWANTTDIVGIHGAGMMNMIMMPIGGNYTEIAGSSVESNQHSPCPNWTIRCALAAGHNVRGILSAVDGQNRPEIDMDRLEMALSR